MTDEDVRSPQHCLTCSCEPRGPLPEGVPVDPYCPEHGDRPTAYTDCSCEQRAEHDAEPAPDVWDESVAPGGYVCGKCGMPTESEPCSEHQQPRLRPGMRPGGDA